jgi:endonuclease YncB( thermonuclease family)
VKRLILLLCCCGLFTATLLAAAQSGRQFDSASARSLHVAASAPAGGDIIGRARALDGDSVLIAGVPIRIWGIDAPEWRQRCRGGFGRRYPCGQLAVRALADRLHAGSVRCVPRLRDKFERVVATCYQGKQDIARWLVSEGLALDWPRYSGGAYHDAEQQARTAVRGLWRGGFVRPWDWRHGRRWAAVTSRP